MASGDTGAIVPNWHGCLVCPLPFALCPLPFALCPLPFALCPLSFYTLRGDGDRSPRAVSPPAPAQARMAEGARTGVGQLRPAQGHHAGTEAEHGLRGRPLPQHRRVLAPRDGDLHEDRKSTRL